MSEMTDEELFGDDPPMLAGMGPAAEGGWEVRTTGASAIVLAMVDSIAGMLDESHAPNYLEMTVKSKDSPKRYLLRLQRSRI